MPVNGGGCGQRPRAGRLVCTWVLLLPGRRRPVRHNTLRLSFGAVAEGQLVRGIERLSEAIEAVLDSRDNGPPADRRRITRVLRPAEQDREKFENCR